MGVWSATSGGKTRRELAEEYASAEDADKARAAAAKKARRGGRRV
jgi:hypothetical protein